MADEPIDIRTHLQVVGEGYRFDGDHILEAAKGRKWHRLLIIGQLEDEPDETDLYVAGNANAGETLVLLEQAKFQIIWEKRRP